MHRTHSISRLYPLLLLSALALGLFVTSPFAADSLSAAAPEPPDGGCGLGWRVVPSINHGNIDNHLYAVEAVSSNDVWVAGTDRVSNASRGLILHWDGQAWSETSSPSPSFTENYYYSLGSASPADVWALGNYGTNSAGYLMIAQRQGGVWNRVIIPTVPVSITRPHGGLSVISATDAWAASYQLSGGVMRTATLHWDGTAWVLVPSPNANGSDNYLADVAHNAAGDLWAVGAYRDGTALKTLILRWDGSQWVIDPSPNIEEGDNTLNAVSSVPSGNTWAVGQYIDTQGISSTLALRWQGALWEQIPSPNPGTKNTLNDVVALSDNDVWAVGRQITSDNRTLTLIMHWDGAAWSVAPSPNVGALFNDLQSVSTVSPGDLWAAGRYRDGAGTYKTLVLRYNDPCGGTPTPAPSTPTPPGTHTPAASATMTAPPSPSVTRTSTALPSSTSVPSPTGASTSTGTAVAGSPTATRSPVSTTLATSTQVALSPSVSPPLTPTGGMTSTPSSTHTPCSITFTDVPEGSTFYLFVRCLACRGILGGYADGTFRPGSDITRGQIAKIVSNAAGFSEPVSGQTYADVPPNQTFYEWIERLSTHEVMAGYGCGGPGEPCDEENRPYFRPHQNATRGQLSKIVSNAASVNDDVTGRRTYSDVPPESTFWLWIERLSGRGVMGGYSCGGAGEPCDGQNRPYFRPYNAVTRGQASKIVANTFFPECVP